MILWLLDRTCQLRPVNSAPKRLRYLLAKLAEAERGQQIPLRVLRLF